MRKHKKRIRYKPERSRHCKEEFLLKNVTGETWEGEQE